MRPQDVFLEFHDKLVGKKAGKKIRWLEIIGRLKGRGARMHLIPQSWPHLHILIGVFPAFGLLCIIGFFIGGILKGDADTRRTCLVLLLLLALLTLPIYLSGIASTAELAGNARFSADAIGSHAARGLTALAALAMTGVAALIALLLSTGERGGASADALVVVLGLAAASHVLLVTDDGWLINHHELQAAAVAPDATPAAWPHVHVILNHAPTVGLVFALIFFVVALILDNDLMKQGSLILFVICAVLGIPTYVTGTAAMLALTQPPAPGISKAVIGAHRDFALLTLTGLAFTGGASWLELWRSRYSGRFSGASLTLVLVFAVVTLGVMAETGHRGGLINHPEIRTAADARPVDTAAAITPAVETLMSGNAWFVPWQIVHFFGYCLIFGAAFAMLLRAFGYWKSVSFAAVHRLLILGFIGVMLNVVSGMLLMLHDSYRYVVNGYTFAPKLAFICVGAIAALYFSASSRLWKLRPGDDAPAAAKWAAAIVFLAWAGVMVCGRLLIFL
jgi:hypothetical protein